MMSPDQNAFCATFVRDRDAALLSDDYATIAAYMRKYGETPRPDGEIFWAGVHKARLSIPTLPAAAHAASRQWLLEHDYRPVGYREGATDVG